jgi:hypothetical protein
MNLHPFGAPVPDARPAAPRGLPGSLPRGETLLWQGSPGTRALLRHTLHGPVVAAYFAIILGWCAWSAIGHGASAHTLGMALLHRAELAVVPLLLMALYAWSIHLSTVYTITDRRVVISFGMAVPVTFNIPFSRIAGAGLRPYPSGAGDIPLRLLDGEKISYFVIWPHARPWRMKHTEPMMRCVPDAAAVSAILGGALARHEALPPATVVAFKPVRMPAVSGLRGRAVAAE